jgi:uncharacterized protein (TIGR02145 family)
MFLGNALFVCLNGLLNWLAEENRMNNPSMILYTIRAFIFAVANFALVACGGDSDCSTKPVDDGREEAIVVDMGRCTNEREGEVIKSGNSYYVCMSKTWAISLSSSSAIMKLSSSSAKVSSNCPSQNAVDPSTVVEGYLKDSRDGRFYMTVTIGSQIWMAQNLDYETADSYYSYCYRNDVNNCTSYGRLYTWAAAMDGAGVCPEGWHLPTQTEWNTLLCAVSGSAVGVRLTAGKMLKFTSGWKNWGDGTDSFSFSARPAGGRSSDGRFFDDGSDAYFWSATESDVYNAYSINLENHSNGAYLLVASKSNAFSVRCLKSSN